MVLVTVFNYIMAGVFESRWYFLHHSELLTASSMLGRPRNALQYNVKFSLSAIKCSAPYLTQKLG